MLSILKRVEELEGGQRRMVDFCKAFMESTRNDYDSIKEDVTEIKADVSKVKENSNRIENSVSRMLGIYEATFKRIGQ